MAGKEKYAIHRLIGKFLMVHLPLQRNCSPRTAGTYREGLERYREYLREKLGVAFAAMKPGHFNAAAVNGFAAWLKDERRCSDATVSLRVITIKSFLKFCASEDISMAHLAAETCEGVKFKKPRRDAQVKYLTEQQLKLLFTMPDPKTRTGRRDRFFLVFAYETGARLSELLDLRLKDIASENGASAVRIKGKGGKIRLVPLFKGAMEYLNAYLKQFHADSAPGDFLFYTRHQGLRTQMRQGAVANMMRKYGAMAHEADPSFPEKIHCHMLRHSLAMSMYRRGTPLEHIRDILGHSQASTTAIYAYTTFEMMKDALGKAGKFAKAATEAPQRDREEELLEKLTSL